MNKWKEKIYDEYNVDKYTEYMKDVIVAWWVILLSIVFAFLLGFIYMLIVFCCAKVLVWAIIGALFLVLIGGFFFLFFYANHYDSQDTTWKWLRYGSYADLGLIVIYAVGVLCCCKQIRLATALIKCTARFIMKTP